MKIIDLSSNLGGRINPFEINNMSQIELEVAQENAINNFYKTLEVGTNVRLAKHEKEVIQQIFNQYSNKDVAINPKYLLDKLVLLEKSGDKKFSRLIEILRHCC